MDGQDDQRELMEHVIARTRHLTGAYKASNARAEELRQTRMRERERARLETRRQELDRRGVELRRQLDTLRCTSDRTTLRSLSRRLRQHHADLWAYWRELESFHARFGPLAQRALS